MQNNYITQRLSLSGLTLNDAEFIAALVNTAEWIKFIGDRNIKTKEDAVAYIQKIIDNPSVHYWTVRINDGKISVGVVTFIKRDYLAHHDIGFAFLPGYTGQGFAYEATSTVLNDLANDPLHTHILATTIKENTRSIQLLQKLGLRFSYEIEVENEKLLVYAVSTNKSV